MSDSHPTIPAPANPCLARDRTRCPFNTEGTLCPHHAARGTDLEEIDRAERRVAHWSSRAASDTVDMVQRLIAQREAAAWADILRRLRSL